MSYDSVSDMLRDMGEDEIAKLIDAETRATYQKLLKACMVAWDAVHWNTSQPESSGSIIKEALLAAGIDTELVKTGQPLFELPAVELDDESTGKKMLH